MGLAELFLLAVGLSMDAFAVAISKGLATEKVKLKHSLITGAWFGGFQTLMPLIGYALASTFAKYVVAVDHWIAFILLCAIGANMVKESFSPESNDTDASFGFKTMLVMAIATSIDALAVGISLALGGDTNIFAAIILIGVITFILSALGIKLGNLFGAKYKSKAELAGGLILIILGIKILLEHLF